MKALTLTQPWATLTALGATRIETRSWDTIYRGPLAIHAAKTWPVEAQRLCHVEPFRAALVAADVPDRVRGGQLSLLRVPDLPLGAIVAVCRLTACIETESERWRRAALTDPRTPHEEAFGDYSPGRFMWFLDDIRPLATPLPARGALGLWDWSPPDDLQLLEAV